MRKRKFEDILEECVSALLEGRRTLEENLELYPALAAQLEPLLRTTEALSGRLQEQAPAATVQEQIRLRFLASASERARARALTRPIRGFGGGAAGFKRWTLVASCAAAASVAAIAGVLAFGNSGGETQHESTTSAIASGSQKEAFVLNLAQARLQLHVVQEKARRGLEIQSSDITALTEATSKLTQTGDASTDSIGKKQLQPLLQQQYILLQHLSNDLSEGADEQLSAALGTTQSLADQWGIAIAEPTASPLVASPTPRSPTPSPSAPASPHPTATASPVPQPTPSGSPAPSPTAEPTLPPVP
ncbi:MAG: hypothetical protein E6J42_00690 [Chloroflexi bacterium]|nr:MAG: hypothetical protein E6J42_00690 [Chloroflexota bacterium]